MTTKYEQPQTERLVVKAESCCMDGSLTEHPIKAGKEVTAANFESGETFDINFCKLLKFQLAY